MKIFVTRKIPQPGLDLLQRELELEINLENRVLTKEEIIKGMKGKDGLLCLLTDSIDKDVIYSEPKLKMIASYAVGYNNIDIKAATEKGIPVSNTPGVLTDTTAEEGWDPMLMHGQDISNKTLGIIGAGRIGTSFALKSKGFNMNVLYVDDRVNKRLEQELKAKKVDFYELLESSDFVSLHVPLNKETHHLIGEKELKMMKKTVVLINTSRGPVIDEQALVKALKERWIFGAGLDVYEYEPDISEELKKLDNVILQPHSASATIETRTKMAIIAAENMIAGLKGEIPPNCVNKEVFQKRPIR